MRSLHQHMAAGLSAVVEREQMRPHQFTALSLIVDNPSLSQSDLARALAIKPSNIVSLIDEMEALGYVRRHPGPVDRRSYALIATDAGRDVRNRMMVLITDYEEQVLAILSDRERSSLRSLIAKILAHATAA